MTDKPDTRLPGMPGTALLDERVFRQLSAEQVAKQYKLLSLFDQQCSQMHMILVLQMSMTGKDPLAEEAQLNAKPLVPLEATHTDMEGSAGSHEGSGHTTQEEASAANPADAMSDVEIEKHLLAYFSLQDTLSEEAALFLSRQTQRSESYIQRLFTKWRSNVRDFIQKLHRNSSGFPTGSHAAPGGPGIPSATTGTHHEKSIRDVTLGSGGFRSNEAARAGGFAAGSEAQVKADHARREAVLRLQACVNETGAVSSLESAESLAALMKASRSWSVREECVKAVGKTQSKVLLQKLAGTQNLLAMIASWIREAAEDGQTGFLGHLLHAIGRFPITQHNLRFNNLDEAVLVVKSYKRGQVSKLAQWALQQWGILTAPAPANPAAAKGTPSKQKLDPSQMAVPLSRPARKAAPSVAQPVIPRKRPAEIAPAPEDPSRVKQAKRQPVTAASSKGSRLDASTLAAIKPHSRAGPPKAKAETGDQAIMSRYQQMAARLKQSIELQKAREDNLSQQLAGKLQKLRSHPPRLTPYSAPHMQLKGCAPLPACGEDSTERMLQASRIRSKAAVKYPTRAQIPNSPGEPVWSDDRSSRLTRPIPCHPINPLEAAEQLRLLQTGGLRLPHLRGRGTNPSQYPTLAAQNAGPILSGQPFRR